MVPKPVSTECKKDTKTVFVHTLEVNGVQDNTGSHWLLLYGQKTGYTVKGQVQTKMKIVMLFQNLFDFFLLQNTKRHKNCFCIQWMSMGSKTTLDLTDLHYKDKMANSSKNVMLFQTYMTCFLLRITKKRTKKVFVHTMNVKPKQHWTLLDHIDFIRWTKTQPASETTYSLSGYFLWTSNYFATIKKSMFNVVWICVVWI